MLLSPFMRLLDGISGTRFLCFMALQGESLELENVLSDFITCCLFYWCALFLKSRQSEYGSHSCYYNQEEVMVKPGNGGMKHLFDVWWWKKKKKLQTSWIFDVCKDLLCRRVKLKVTALETGLKSLLSKFKCASFKSPQTTTVSTL